MTFTSKNYTYTFPVGTQITYSIYVLSFIESNESIDQPRTSSLLTRLEEEDTIGGSR
jgi:hypothetical protein